jgi:flagellar basal body-associated protein FliL
MARKPVSLSVKTGKKGNSLCVFIVAGVVIVMLAIIGYLMYTKVPLSKIFDNEDSDTDTDSDDDDDDNDDKKKKSTNPEKCTTCKVGVNMENFM